MAVALAAMILACSFAVVVTSEEADAADSTIELRVGDTFSYTPKTNLTSTITASGTAMQSSGGWLTLSNGVLSGSPEASGSSSVTLTASWTSGSLSQTATQTINFTVYDRIAITSASSATAIVDQAFSYSFTYTGPSGTTVATPTIPSGASWLTWNASTQTLSGTPTAVSDPISITFNVSFASISGDVTDSRSLTLVINTYDGVAITSAATSETYVGADYEYTVTSNVDGASFTADISAVSGLGVTWASPTLSGSFISSAASSSTPYYTEYTVKYGASATQGGVSTTASLNHTIRVYAALAFTTTPTISQVTAAAASADNTKSLLISATISGATSVSIDWGDGTTPTTYTPQDDSIVIVPMHDYATDGEYTVTITATNDQGDTQTKIKYDTVSGSWTEVSSGDDASGFIDEYSLVIILAAVAVVCAIVGMLWFRPAWIIAVICIAAIIACIALGTTAIGDII